MTTSKSKTVEEIYKKKNLHQHVLDRPGMYIGTNKIVCEEQYILQDNSLIKEFIEYNPALLKIFDEIIVNAIDHTVRDSTCTTIKVNFDIKNNTISVYNNGKGIPIVKHKEYDIYIPELIFGNLLTSSNYDDNERRIVGGTNGLGSKVSNIYSKKFIVETCDSKYTYYQEFRDNMYTKDTPIIKKCTNKSYTKITFQPDFKRFGLSKFTKDILALLYKRVYDCIACTDKRVNIYLNNEKLKQKDFLQYISLYTQDKIVSEKIEQKQMIWEYAVKISSNHEQISFVNGICTFQGGKHVDYVLNQIVKKLTEMIQTKKKIQNIKPSYIKDHLTFFIKATVENPSFSSQSKEYLSTPSKDFGIKFEVSDQFITKLYKSGIVEEIISFTNYKNLKELDKTAAPKLKSKIKVPNLEDAYNAGTSKSSNCSLILTEGLSAKTFAMSGLSIIGRNNYGIFPLRGKLLNIREATQKQLVSNEEVNNIKLIMGLQHNKKYTDTKNLRYNNIMILTDADHDGTHIRCLLMNMFHVWWPELLEIKGFLRSLKTPVVKVSNKKSSTQFYTLKDYKDWEKEIKNPSSYNIKYYKGLGTSTAAEAKEIFKDMNNNEIQYFSSSKTDTDKSITLAFEKKQADMRKDWLQTYNFDMVLDQANHDISFNEAINKELIHFSMYDVIRSIPSICDGLKPSQRKVIYTMFKKNYSKEIKVAQLGASVAELTNYHHGEASLYGTIVNMAQNYPGSNNINLLKPNGQFGTKLQLGKDAASPRYIFTELNDITHKVFNNEDFNILDYIYDDGKQIEPLYYVPVLPMVLVNGAQGIGTGYSTTIPAYNPKDIINNIKMYLDKKEMKTLIPWYANFNGKIESTDNNNFIMYGNYSIYQERKIINISEIPIGVGIDDYKTFLENLSDENHGIKDIKNKSTENTVDFDIIFDNVQSLVKFTKLNIIKILKLSKNISTKNFHLLNKKGTITYYENTEKILKDFINIRLKFNTKRKKYLLDKYLQELKINKNKIRFLTEIMNATLQIYKKSKTVIYNLLESNSYDKINDTYDYLINLPIYSFTKEKLETLQKNLENIKIKYDYTEKTNEKNMLLNDLDEIIQ